MWEALFDNKCLLKAIQQNGLTSEIFFENTLAYSRDNKNLPSFFFVFSENNFSLISGSICNVFPDSITSVKKLLLSTVSVSQWESELAWTVAGWLSVTTLLRTVSLPDPIFFTFIFYSLFNFCWYVRWSFCILNFVVIICNRYRVVKYRLFKYITFTNSFYVYWIR